MTKDESKGEEATVMPIVPPVKPNTLMTILTPQTSPDLCNMYVIPLVTEGLGEEWWWGQPKLPTS